MSNVRRFTAILATDVVARGWRTDLADRAPNFSARRFCRGFLGLLSRFQTTTARWLLGRNAHHNKVLETW